MIDSELVLPVSDQCRLLGLARSTYYYEGASETPENLALMEIIDRLYLAHPENGSRMMVRVLARMGHVVNRKRVQRLMNLMGIRSLAPQKKTTTPHPEHFKYPYLLRGLKIDHPNHVWCADLTYVPFKKGFLYLVAIMDWHSRKVLSWRLSNTMTVDFCVAALDEALALYGTPEIFNTDQGSQGEFNRLSQHLMMMEVFDGSSTTGCGSSSAQENEIARSSAAAARSGATVLDRDCQRLGARGSCSSRRCFATGGTTPLP
ncbi:MAG: IS3 family transposase [Acidimicrobiales bacterium]